jgi:hypothetical protein
MRARGSWLEWFQGVFVMRRSAPSAFRWASVAPRRDRDAALSRAQLHREREYLAAMENSYGDSDGEASPIFARSPVFTPSPSPSPARVPGSHSLADALRRAPVSPPPIAKWSRSLPTPSPPSPPMAMVAPANEVTRRPSKRMFARLLGPKAPDHPPPKHVSQPLPESTLEDFGYTTDQPDQPAIQPVTHLSAVDEQWQDEMMKRFTEAYCSNVYLPRHIAA